MISSKQDCCDPSKGSGSVAAACGVEADGSKRSSFVIDATQALQGVAPSAAAATASARVVQIDVVAGGALQAAAQQTDALQAGQAEPTADNAEEPGFGLQQTTPGSSNGPCGAGVAAAEDHPAYVSMVQFGRLMELYRSRVSTVLRAVCLSSGRDVIIKRYIKRKMSVRAVHKMRREIRLMYQLRGEAGMAQVLGDFEDELHYCIVVEWYAAGDLYHRSIVDGHIMNEHWVCTRVVTPLLQALSVLHDHHNIVHRDIKPENIFLTAHDELRLGDFGLAIRQDEELPFLRAGTLDYMAPEVLENTVIEKMDEAPHYTAEQLKPLGLVPYNEKVDVWAVGVLTYEMMMGETPFYREAQEETEKMIMKCDLLPVYFPRHQLLSPWADFVRTALQKDPRHRPSAAKLLQHRWIKQHRMMRLRTLPPSLGGGSVLGGGSGVPRSASLPPATFTKAAGLGPAAPQLPPAASAAAGGSTGNAATAAATAAAAAALVQSSSSSSASLSASASVRSRSSCSVLEAPSSMGGAWTRGRDGSSSDLTALPEAAAAAGLEAGGDGPATAGAAASTAAELAPTQSGTLTAAASSATLTAQPCHCCSNCRLGGSSCSCTLCTRTCTAAEEAGEEEGVLPRELSAVDPGSAAVDAEQADVAAPADTMAPATEGARVQLQPLHVPDSSLQSSSGSGSVRQQVPHPLALVSPFAAAEPLTPPPAPGAPRSIQAALEAEAAELRAKFRSASTGNSLAPVVRQPSLLGPSRLYSCLGFGSAAAEPPATGAAGFSPSKLQIRLGRKAGASMPATVTSPANPASPKAQYPQHQQQADSSLLAEPSSDNEASWPTAPGRRHRMLAYLRRQKFSLLRTLRSSPSHNSSGAGGSFDGTHM